MVQTHVIHVPLAAQPSDSEPAGLAAVEVPASSTEEERQEEAKILQAMAFYREVLKAGPRLAREVLAEGKRHGHAQRTQERARSRLNVQGWPI